MTTGTEHSETTLALAKKEMRDHLTPAMSSLFTSMSSRDVIVRATIFNSSTGTTAGTTAMQLDGYRVVKSKNVHFMRHGQGFHNMLADRYREEGKTWDQFVSDSRNPYVRPEILDAPLTHKGRLQAMALQPTARSLEPPVEVVVVSPQCRAAQTGLIAFGHMVGDEGGEGGKKFIAHEYVREESGVHVCDQRRSISNAKVEFPQVEWGGIEHDEDPIFKDDKRESKEEVGERIYQFLMWMMEREESNIAVASHSGWLMTLFNGVAISDENLKPWFQTGEMRSVVLTWMKKV